MNYIINVKNVTKRYGKVVALDNISLKIGKGITGFVGPNGAGKTTLINIITGLITPDSGEVLIDTDASDFRWDIGVIRDKIAFPPELTVERFLERIAEMYKVDYKRVRYVLKTVGLINVKHKKIGSLSMGYKKRVGIAQAVVHEPLIIIADEPFTQLDPIIKVDIRDTMDRLSKDEKINFFVSSHDISDLEMIADRVILINNGKIIREINKEEKSTMMVRCDSPKKLLQHLLSNGVNARIDGNNVRIEIADMKKILSVLSNYPGNISGINMATIEGVMRDELEFT